jgi:hypothetical protein
MNTIINKKKYYVSRNLNDMEYNFIFTDKNNIDYLVDGYDVQEWAEELDKEWKGIDTAIEYAKEVSSMNDTGLFWWKINNA